MRRTCLLTLLLVLLTACTPAVVSPATPQAGQPATVETATPEPAQPTATAEPTATPAPSFPLSRNEALPALQPISTGNARLVIPVARLDTQDISEVMLTENGDRLIFITNLGYQVLDLTSFTPQIYQPTRGLVFGRKVSPSGTLMAEMVPGNPKIFDLELQVTNILTGQPVCQFSTVNPSNNNELVFHPTGIITYQSSGNDNHILGWDASNCRQVLTVESAWRGAHFSADGEQIIKLENDELFIIETANGKKRSVGTYPNLRGGFLLPDGESILVTTQTGNAVYNLTSGELLKDLPGNMGKSNVNYTLSEDGQWLLVSGSDITRAVRLSDYAMFSLPASGVDGGNGNLILQDSIWNIEQQRSLADIRKYGQVLWQKTILLSADGMRAAASPNEDPYYIDVLDLTTGKPAFTIPDYHHPISLPDRSGFIATSNGTTAFFDYTSDQPRQVLNLHYTDGRVFENGVIIVWDSLGNIHQLDPAGALLHSAQLPFALSEAPQQNLAPAWAQGQEAGFEDFLATFMTPIWSNWAVSHNRQLGMREVQMSMLQFFRVGENTEQWQTVSSADVIATLNTGPLVEMTFSPDDSLAAVLFPQRIAIYDPATGQELRSIPLPVKAGRVYDFEFSPDNTRLLLSHEVSSEDYSAGIHDNITLRVFDTASGTQLKFFEIKQDYPREGCNVGMPFAVTADSSRLITLTAACKLGIYSMTDWGLINEFHNPFNNANIDLALSPDGNLLAVAFKNKLELWDLPAVQLLQVYPHPTGKTYPDLRQEYNGAEYQIAFSPDGALLGSRYTTEMGFNYNSVILLWGVPAEQ